MIHSMMFQPEPFEMIKAGTKTIELRLFDEKRRKIQVGDIITFTNPERDEELEANVIELMVFDSFEELYNNLPLLECSYTEDDIGSASPEDMDAHYSKDMQQKYGVVGIRIKCLNV